MIYGGGGAIGSAVASTFARVFLAGRTQATLDTVARDIRTAGREGHSTVLDALDEHAVDAFADDVAARAGGIDVSFNLISHGDVQADADGGDRARGPALEDVGNAAAFAASDKARMMTAATINISCGALVDL